MRKEPGFALRRPDPGTLYVLTWNHAQAGIIGPQTDWKLRVSGPHWAIHTASLTDAPQRSNPAWPLRGMTFDALRNAIKQD